MKPEEKLLEQLQKELPDFNFELIQVLRANDIKYDAVAIIDKFDPAIRTVVYIDGLLIAEAKELVKTAMVTDMIYKPDPDNITPEYIYDNVTIKILGKDLNRLYIQEKPTFRINDDLIGLYYIPIEKEGQAEIINNLVQLHNLDMDKLHQSAIENLQKDICLTYLHDEVAAGILSFTDQKRVYPINSYEQIYARLKEGTMKEPFVLSNTNHSYGAANLILADNIFKEIPEDLYLVPSSLHEIMCFPASLGYTPIELQKSLSQVNDNDPRDMLTDKVYKADAKTRTLQIAADRYGFVPQCPDTTILPSEVRKPHRSI